jgi:hypothetical protein
MDANGLVYMGVGAGGGVLAGLLSGAPWLVLTAGILGLGTAYFFESGGTGLPYPDTDPDATTGGGGGSADDEPAGASGTDYNAIIQSAIAYAQHYGYTISDRGGYLDGQLMFCEPMGAVALHATLGLCAWKYCDIPAIVAGRLGQTDQWVRDFHDGFHHDQDPNWSNPSSEGYKVGLSYRQQYMPGAV